MAATPLLRSDAPEWRRRPDRAPQTVEQPKRPETVAAAIDQAGPGNDAAGGKTELKHQ
jgi:hypothetical protein